MRNRMNTNFPQLKVMITWVLILPLLFTTLSCDSDDEGFDEGFDDEYYVKYIIKSKTIYITSKVAEIKMANASTEEFTFNNGNWEMTIGPVKKGFNASCDARHDTSQDLARTYIDIEVHVSKNNGPFALKANDTSPDVRMSASLSHTVD